MCMRLMCSIAGFLTREFESIVWLYKFAPATLNVEDGEYVHEIDVFYCRMKEDKYSIKPFSAMDELLPRHTVFIIEYGEKLDLLMHHKEMSVVHGEQKWKCGVSEIQRDIRIDADTLNIQGQSMDAVYNGLLSQISGLSVHGEQKWKCGVSEIQRDIRIDADTLNIQGQSMDAVYNGLLSQISGLSASTKEEYKEQVDIRKQIESIQKQILMLQKRIKAEKQFNRQMELNTEVRQLRKEITLLTDKLNKNNI